MKVIKLLLLIFPLFTSCEKKEECSFPEIKWDEKTSTIKTKDSKMFNSSLSGEISSKLKKIGDGHIDAEIGVKLDNLSEEESSTAIKYDEKFVQNYNLCAAEICGLLGLIERKSTTPESKRKFEEQLIDAVSKFYKRVKGEQDVINEKTTTDSENKPKSNNGIKPKTDPSVQEVEMEISIQLPYETDGFKNISVDGKKANISTSSTKLNPRLIIKSKSLRNQKIVIVSQKNDTCILERVFDIKQKDKFPIRFIPNCK